jgi:hypothetical protein
MKKIILVFGMYCLLICCYGQSDNLQFGFKLTYNSIRQVVFDPPPVKSYHFFSVISPGLKVGYKRHRVGINYDLIAPLINGGRLGGFKKKNPKGVSGYYSFAFFQKKQFSAIAGLDFRFYEYFTDPDIGTFNIRESEFYNRGSLLNLKNIGPHLGVIGNWGRFSAEISCNFSKARVRHYNLSTNREGVNWSNYLIMNWGIIYWIKR